VVKKSSCSAAASDPKASVQITSMEADFAAKVETAFNEMIVVVLEYKAA
jgi:hypothetical protein